MSRRFSVNAKTKNVPLHPNISFYLEPEPLYPTVSACFFVFSEQSPEQFKSTSSRNHPMRHLSESSCLPNQAGFEASCFQPPRQEKRERI